MNSRAWLPSLFLIALSACGGGSSSPTAPSGGTSFLTGTWRGTLVLQVNPGDPNAPRTDEWNDGVDIRGRASDKPSVFPRFNSFGSSLARYDNKWQCGDHAREYAAGADQHSR